MRLPKRTRTVRTKPTAMSAGPHPARPLSVLVVDDNRDAADSTAAVLDLYGYTVRVCYDGTAALVAVVEFDPDVCLLDVMMPGMDGLELAARLLGSAPAVPPLLIALTGCASAAEQERTTAAGFHLHLVKPVDPAVLVGALAEIRRLFVRTMPGVERATRRPGRRAVAASPAPAIGFDDPGLRDMTRGNAETIRAYKDRAGWIGARVREVAARARDHVAAVRRFIGRMDRSRAGGY
jgi:two-component system OmpR family response regulator